LFQTYTIPSIKQALLIASSLVCPIGGPIGGPVAPSEPTKAREPPSDDAGDDAGDHFFGRSESSVIEGGYINGFQLCVDRSLLKLGKLGKEERERVEDDGSSDTTSPTPTLPCVASYTTPPSLNPFNLPQHTLPNDFTTSPPLNYLTLSTLYSSKIKILIELPPVPPERELPPVPPERSQEYILCSVTSFYRLYHLLVRISECYEQGSCLEGVKVSVNVADDEKDDAASDEEVRKKIAANNAANNVLKQNKEYDLECPICMASQIEVVCPTCASGFCAECRAEWQANVIGRTGVEEVRGCAVCYTNPSSPTSSSSGAKANKAKTPITSSWHIESWTQSDLVEEIDSLEGMVGKELDEIRRKGRRVTGRESLKGFVGVCLDDV
jgi:hypothetical protein